MTPRERVLTALSHRQPDRTPCDFWAEEPTWNRLLAHSGHNDRNRLLDELAVDIRHLDLPRPRGTSGRRRHIPELLGRAVRLQGRRPGARCVRTAAVPWPTPSVWPTWKRSIGPRPTSSTTRRLPSSAAASTGTALLYGFADVWQRPGLVRGWEGMFLDMVERPEWVHFLGRKFTDFYREDYTRAAEATGGRIDLYLLISDLGGQSGPLISKSMFRQFIAPYLREMIDCIHGLGGKVLYHSCGAIASLIPELIALGVDVLDPIQPVGPAMQPERLKADYGGRISFHGGIDMQRLLPHGYAGGGRGRGPPLLQDARPRRRLHPRPRPPLSARRSAGEHSGHVPGAALVRIIHGSWLPIPEASRSLHKCIARGGCISSYA